MDKTIQGANRVGERGPQDIVCCILKDMSRSQILRNGDEIPATLNAPLECVVLGAQSPAESAIVMASTFLAMSSKAVSKRERMSW